MYYQEKWEDGCLYIKTTPTGDWRQITPNLADLCQGVKDGHLAIAQALNSAYLLGKSSAQVENKI